MVGLCERGRGLHTDLLDESDGLGDGLRHLAPDHHDGQPPPAEGRGGDLLELRQGLFRRYDSHVFQLLQNQVGDLDPRRVVRRQRLQHADQLGDQPRDLVVLAVIVPILYMIPSQNLQLPVVVLALPL